MSSRGLTRRGLRTWLEERDLAYQQDGDVFDVPIPHTSERFVRIALVGEAGVVVFGMAMNLEVPAERLDDARIYASRLNVEELVGTWVVNPRTRHVMYRATLPMTAAGEQEIWAALRLVVARVGGDAEKNWADALGLPVPPPSLPDWVYEDVSPAEAEE